MQALCAEAMRSPDVQRLSLRVYRDNVAAVALYRDLGFQPVEDARRRNCCSCSAVG
jgi:ribosomal protein S18 acetylase RimI-like enzyme